MNARHMRVVTTSRLTLEPQTAEHVDAMFVVLNDPAIYKYENEPPASLDWLRTRFTKLETRCSADGHEQWLNWVIRAQTAELIGYVQATIHANGDASIAYVLNSAFWGRGFAREAVEGMVTELVTHYGVRQLVAVLKRDNLRSAHLLERLEFAPGAAEHRAAHDVEPDEVLMARTIPQPSPA
ncbi:MAG: GNAT family N-acetyltransferase [Betaproteobacteria bacterium]